MIHDPWTMMIRDLHVRRIWHFCMNENFVAENETWTAHHNFSMAETSIQFEVNRRVCTRFRRRTRVICRNKTPATSHWFSRMWRHSGGYGWRMWLNNELSVRSHSSATHTFTAEQFQLHTGAEFVFKTMKTKHEQCMICSTKLNRRMRQRVCLSSPMVGPSFTKFPMRFDHIATGCSRIHQEFRSSLFLFLCCSLILFMTTHWCHCMRWQRCFCVLCVCFYFFFPFRLHQN